MNKSYYFSIFGGYIYEANQLEEKVLDSFQIPLINLPKNSCKKCHGRFYSSFDLANRHFVICTSCAKKCVDFQKILDKKNGK